MYENYIPLKQIRYSIPGIQKTQVKLAAPDLKGLGMDVKTFVTFLARYKKREVLLPVSFRMIKSALQENGLSIDTDEVFQRFRSTHQSWVRFVTDHLITQIVTNVNSFQLKSLCEDEWLLFQLETDRSNFRLPVTFLESRLRVSLDPPPKKISKVMPSEWKEWFSDPSAVGHKFIESVPGKVHPQGTTIHPELTKVGGEWVDTPRPKPPSTFTMKPVRPESLPSNDPPPETQIAEFNSAIPVSPPLPAPPAPTEPATPAPQIHAHWWSPTSEEPFPGTLIHNANPSAEKPTDTVPITLSTEEHLQNYKDKILQRVFADETQRHVIEDLKIGDIVTSLPSNNEPIYYYKPNEQDPDDPEGFEWTQKPIELMTPTEAFYTRNLPDTTFTQFSGTKLILSPFECSNEDRYKFGSDKHSTHLFKLTEGNGDGNEYAITHCKLYAYPKYVSMPSELIEPINKFLSMDCRAMIKLPTGLPLDFVMELGSASRTWATNLRKDANSSNVFLSIAETKGQREELKIKAQSLFCYFLNLIEFDFHSFFEKSGSANYLEDFRTEVVPMVNKFIKENM